MGDDFIWLWVFWFQKLFQTDDSGQDQGKFTDNQSLQGDQSEESDGKGQECSSFQFEEQEKGQQKFLAFLSTATTSCKIYND